MTTDANFSRIEEGVRRFWRRAALPEQARNARRGGPPYVIVQQPLPAAGLPEVDQLRLLAFSDSLARYHAMRGREVCCYAGWSCHGLPLELEVERAQESGGGAFDLAAFTTSCQQRALDGVQRGEALAEWLGVWLDRATTFSSVTLQAIGTVWGALRRLWDSGKLRQEHAVVPVCPRCATPLSTAEAAYRSAGIDARSVWVALPWEGEPGTYFLAWTEAPWMLVGMVALAANPSADYLVVEWTPDADQPPLKLILADASLEHSLPGPHRRVRRMPGKSLRGTHYRPLFTFLPSKGADELVLSAHVPLDRGTGLMPVTPSFHTASLAVARDCALPVPDLLDVAGNLSEPITLWRGLSPLDAESLLIEDLDRRGLLLRQEAMPRSQPLCPYCGTPLLDQARSVWLVEQTDGRPWIVGRDRPWGNPLPIWHCDRCGKELCVAGVDELAHRSGLAREAIELHRPALDRIAVPCTQCGGPMHRVSPVLDPGFEAAVLSSLAVPRGDAADLAIGLENRLPDWLADVKQVTALLGGTDPYSRSEASPPALPEIEGEAVRGDKMAAELAGRNSFPLPQRLPADAFRCAAAMGMAPAQAERDLLEPMWRLALATVGADSSASGSSAPVRQLLDRWLRARLCQTSRSMMEDLEAASPHHAAQDLQALLDDVVDWALPLDPGGLSHILPDLCALAAPFAPHVAEAVYRRSGARAAGSIHLAAWPVAEVGPDDPTLLRHMALVRRLATLGRTARTQAAIHLGVLLPLAIVGDLLGVASEITAQPGWTELLALGLGVDRVEWSPDAVAYLEWRLSLNRGLYVERGIAPDEMDAALAGQRGGEATRLAAQLLAGFSVSFDVGGQHVTLLPEEVSLVPRARPGWAAAVAAGLIVILR